MTMFPRAALHFVALLPFVLAPAVVSATEGGGTSKAVGVDTVMAGVMAPPGLRLTTFVAHYDANETLDSAGNPRPGISNFDLYADAVTFRLQYVWSGAQLWGANIETRVGFNAYVHSTVNFDVKTPSGTIHRQDSANGNGDTLFAPALLGWHSDHFHQIAGLEFFLPTGTFETTKLANPSRGYYSAAPAYWFTWLPDDAIEVSGNAVYLFNAKNQTSNYKSGNEVSLDYGLGYAVTPAWQLGASGYLYKQVTDDELNGRTAGDGNRGRVAAIGPFLRFHPSPDWGITLKWQIEGYAENRTQGNRYFLQFAIKLF